MITIDKLEEMRIKLRKKYTLFIIIGIIVTLIILGIVITYNIPIEFTIFGVVLIIILAFICTHKQAKEYNLAFKNYFVKSSLEKNIYKPKLSTRKWYLTFYNCINKYDVYGR